MRDAVKKRFLKDLGEKWKNWKCDLKDKYFDEACTPDVIVSRCPVDMVNREQWVDLVRFWFSDEGMV